MKKIFYFHLLFPVQSRINSKSFVHSICVGVRRSYGFENQSLQKAIGIKLRRNCASSCPVAVRRNHLPSQGRWYTGWRSFKGKYCFPILALTATILWKSIDSLSLSLPESVSTLTKSGIILQLSPRSRPMYTGTLCVLTYIRDNSSSSS